MSIPLSILRVAAFWSSWVCLGCGKELFEFTQQCPSCGSADCRPAAEVLSTYEAVSGDEEGE